ncbi:MAG: UbiA family prenyltransferase [Pseudonocardiaceae bacterium]|nr:MAG: UbiA family prenyltransferase [Pseudonocardiaceae bacterium]
MNQTSMHTASYQQAILPIVVDLDHTYLKVDSLYELFAASLFSKPAQTLRSLFQLTRGIAAFKCRLVEIAKLDSASLPVHRELISYLEEQSARGRDIHLATAAHISIASNIASEQKLFKSIYGTNPDVNLKGAAKARQLLEAFPDGFVYAGDSTADIPVWQAARAAIVVSPNRKLANHLQASGIHIEQAFIETSPSLSSWWRAFRPHQWTKNLLIFVPLILGAPDVTLTGLITTFIFMLLLCGVASLTYVVNDIADVAADRKHWSKRRRPFASGSIPIRDGLIAASFGLPILLLIGLLISPLAAACLISYTVITLGYSFGWKRIPLFDTFLIALLFTIRVLMGTITASLITSVWLMVFSMFFFFSMALAKRHTEILRAAEHGLDHIDGRGYRADDAVLTLVMGLSSSMAAIVLVVFYMVEEVFTRRMIYAEPLWLWVTPMAIFLFVCRIWILSHRGRMTDDPVAFALRDRVCLALGACVVAAIALAIS